MTRARLSLLASALGWALYFSAQRIPGSRSLRAVVEAVFWFGALAAFVTAAVLAALAFRERSRWSEAVVAAVVACALPALIVLGLVLCFVNPRGCFS